MTYHVDVPGLDIFSAWRSAARRAISHAIPPTKITWGSTGDLFHDQVLPAADGTHAAVVPHEFLKLAQLIIWHRDPQRFSLLYKALWRLDRREGQPLSHGDPLGGHLQLMARAVRRDIHKMHAFVRFRELPSSGIRRRFGAWFEPQHHTLEPGAAFFAKRFADMDWSIATPYLTAHFRDDTVQFGPGVARPALPDDATEDLWATYFVNIFNPARIKLSAMTSEMPKLYWKNLPETQLIPDMVAHAEVRARKMRNAGSTPVRPGSKAVVTRYRESITKPVDAPRTLSEARDAALACQRCALCGSATQTVWGEGQSNARLVILGEQPGDQEDLAGKPFVGPAGLILRQMMAEAGLDREDSWMTNAVKHFKFVSRGKRRLHQNPNRGEIRHCRWWLDLELALVRPDLVLALGHTAAYAATDCDSPLAERRGKIEPGRHGGPVLITWHPSYFLRLSDEAARAEAQDQMAADLLQVKNLLAPKPFFGASTELRQYV